MQIIHLRDIQRNALLQRTAEPVLLGAAANTCINILFNPHAVVFSIDEFVIAILLAVPIAALNRYIDKQLEQSVSWATQPLRRFSIQLVLILFCLVVILNALGSIYLYITGQGFFTLLQMVIINLVTLCLSVVLTLTKWAVRFYQRWMHAERSAVAAASVIDALSKQLIQPAIFIGLQKGTSKINIAPENIRVAKIAFGAVRVYADTGIAGIFPGSMAQLYQQLPKHLFFQVARDAVLHKKAIGSIVSASFGKIVVGLHGDHENGVSFTVSRPKAAAFRKWYHSNSSL